MTELYRAHTRRRSMGSAMPSTAHANRERRAAQMALLRRCRSTLALWGRLHHLSVRIGEAQQAGLSDSELFASEIRAARRIIEQADTLCAEITKLERS